MFRELRWAVAAACVGGVGLAGDLDTREFGATVVKVAVVEHFTFDDRLAALSEKDPAQQAGDRACALDLSIENKSAIFARPERVFASARACTMVKPGARVVAQFLGLANNFQFVSLKVGSEWFSLPLMRRTATTHAQMLQCLAGKSQHCAPRDAPPL
jgi:hypothetical protein